MYREDILDQYCCIREVQVVFLKTVKRKYIVPQLFGISCSQIQGQSAPQICTVTKLFPCENRKEFGIFAFTYDAGYIYLPKIP